MKEYKDIPKESEDKLHEPAVAYEIAEPQQRFSTSLDMDDDIPLDENGVPIGYTVDEVFDEINLDWSETSGIDFIKLFRMVHSGEINLDDMTDERLYSPEFKYEPYPGFTPKPSKNITPE
jgi:hypothetical protein